eukprot:14143761-Alexandrium_andersonii.AAC.1
MPASARLLALREAPRAPLPHPTCPWAEARRPRSRRALPRGSVRACAGEKGGRMRAVVGMRWSVSETSFQVSVALCSSPLALREAPCAPLPHTT